MQSRNVLFKKELFDSYMQFWLCRIILFRSISYKMDTPALKDESGAVIIVDYSRYYTVVNGWRVVPVSIFPLLICETTYLNLLRSAK